MNFHLAAAHCIAGTSVVKNNFRVVSVRLGEHNLATEVDCEDGDCADPVVDVPIEETIVHESYTPNSPAQSNDIALIRLSRPITYTNWIKPICLPVSQNLRTKNLDNKPMVVAGFGKTETGMIK